MFGSLPSQRYTRPSTADLQVPSQAARGVMTEGDIYQIAVAINEDPAKYVWRGIWQKPSLAFRSRAAIIDDCEKSLRQMGFGGLTALRKELARVHQPT